MKFLKFLSNLYHGINPELEARTEKEQCAIDLSIANAKVNNKADIKAENKKAISDFLIFLHLKKK